MIRDHYYARFCKNGHATISWDEIDAKSKCQNCGDSFYIRCIRCGAPFLYEHDLFEEIDSADEFPVLRPNRPNQCMNCGNKIVWGHGN